MPAMSFKTFLCPAPAHGVLHSIKTQSAYPWWFPAPLAWPHILSCAYVMLFCGVLFYPVLSHLILHYRKRCLTRRMLWPRTCVVAMAGAANITGTGVLTSLEWYRLALLDECAVTIRSKYGGVPSCLLLVVDTSCLLNMLGSAPDSCMLATVKDRL